MSICKIYSLLAKNFQNIKDLPISFGIKMLTQIIEENNEQKVWEMWITKYPDMTKEKFMSFSEFYSSMKPKIASKKTAKEFLDEAKLIRESVRG